MVAILVVLTILACIGIDAAIQFSTARRRRQILSPATNPLAGFTLQGVSLPEGLFVDPAHTWVAVNTNGKTRIGLDQFILKAVGRIDEIVTPEAGKEVRRGETLFTVRQGDRKIEIPAPIDGIVDTVNEQVAANAEMVKLNPYDQGWICSLTPLHLATNLKKLSIAEEAMDWIQAEIQRFQEFVSLRPVNHLALGTVMQDGGLPTEGVLELMDNETWNLFSFEFVRVHAGH
jgi:glycine cleavage system H protein